MKLTKKEAEIVFGRLFQFDGDLEGLKKLNNYLDGKDLLVKSLLNIKENNPELAKGDLWDELIDKIYKEYDINA